MASINVVHFAEEAQPSNTRCQFPKCQEEAWGVCSLCSERSCQKHAIRHFVVHPFQEVTP